MSKIDVQARHGKVSISFDGQPASEISRAEALAIAIDMITACHMAGDLSDIPSDLYSNLESWRRTIDAPDLDS